MLYLHGKLLLRRFLRVSLKRRKKEDTAMWAYESVFYQIYPLGFCGAPFENDGTQQAPETAGIRKVIDWIGHIRKLGAMPYIFPPCLNPIPMDTIQGISGRWTAALARMRILRRFAPGFMRKESAWFWTGCLTMWEEASGPFRMC